MKSDDFSKSGIDCEWGETILGEDTHKIFFPRRMPQDSRLICLPLCDNVSGDCKVTLVHYALEGNSSTSFFFARKHICMGDQFFVLDWFSCFVAIKKQHFLSKNPTLKILIIDIAPRHTGNAHLNIEVVCISYWYSFNEHPAFRSIRYTGRNFLSLLPEDLWNKFSNPLQKIEKNEWLQVESNSNVGVIHWYCNCLLYTSRCV